MRILDDITNFIFVSDEPEDADIIFIPGGSYPEIAEMAAMLWKEKNVKFILPSGKFSVKRGFFPGPLAKSDIYKKPYTTEWDFLKDVLIQNGVKEEFIIKEDEATNTYENSLYSKKITDQMGLDVKKAILCCKSFHARRCLMYYQLAYQTTQFIVCPTDTQGITKVNWATNDDGINKVLGELERCGHQFTNIIKCNK